jgi:hypothetical protein
VLQIRDVYSGSQILIFFIHSGSGIPDPTTATKELMLARPTVSHKKALFILSWQQYRVQVYFLVMKREQITKGVAQ